MTTRKDWLLAALSESANGYLSPVQVQKALFLFRKGAEGYFDRSQFYDFYPYHYGPFSPDIYYDLEELEKCGLVQVGMSGSGKRKMYFITPEGRAAADRTGMKAVVHTHTLETCRGGSAERSSPPSCGTFIAVGRNSGETVFLSIRHDPLGRDMLR